jgi:Fe-S oxidoreductase
MMPALRPYEVDRQPNIFGILQAQRDAERANAANATAVNAASATAANAVKAASGTCGNNVTHAKGALTLFAPGCMFLASAPDLAEKVFAWLQSKGLAQRLATECCGNTLKYAAPRESGRFEAYTASKLAALRAEDVDGIIAACPNCYGTYRSVAAHEGGREIEVRALSDVLLEHFDMREARERMAGAGSICVHDSCPDRQSGLFGRGVRALLGGGLPASRLLEMQHHGASSQCCGFGRLLASTNPEASDNMRIQRVEEFAKTRANTLVTYCFTCANAFCDINALLQYAQDERPETAKDADAPPRRACHYLELLFGHRIDWDAANERMWKAYELCLEQAGGDA